MSILASLAAKFGPQTSAPTKVEEPIPNNAANTPHAAATTAGAAEVNPLDALGDIWAKNPSAASASGSSYLSLKPEDIQSQAKNLNFGSLVTPEHQSAIAGGGEGAAKAVIELLNTLGQSVFAASAMQSGNFVNTGLGKFKSGFDADLPNVLKSHQAADSLFAQNDILQKPAVAPVAKAVMAQLQTQFPGASQQELVEATKEYLQNAFGGINKPATPVKAKQSPDQIDWTSFLDN